MAPDEPASCCSLCFRVHESVRRSILLSSAKRLFGRVDLIHLDEHCTPSGVRHRRHVREWRFLGKTLRRAAPCDCKSPNEHAPQVRSL